MAIPKTPSEFLAQSGNGLVYLSWLPSVGATSTPNASSSNPTSASYNLYRSPDSVSYSLLNGVNQLYYYDTPSSGQVTYYRVSANGTSGTSQLSTPTQTTVVDFGKISLGQVRLAAQQRADMVNSDFVTKQEWNSYINKSYMELYDILVQTYADDYYVAQPYKFNTDSRTPSLYALPSNLYKLLGVDLAIVADQTYITLKKFPFIKRNRYLYATTQTSVLGVYNLAYRLVGNDIEFIPNPLSGRQIQLWYIPKPTVLLADWDVLDGISGWEEYVITDAAIKAMQKEESDVSVLMAQKAALMQRITAAASNRDAGMPEAVSDVRPIGGYGGAWGDDGPSGGI